MQEKNHLHIVSGFDYLEPGGILRFLSVFAFPWRLCVPFCVSAFPLRLCVPSASLRFLCVFAFPLRH